MLGTAIERKPKVEQVNVTGGRLLREAKVCYHSTALIGKFFPSALSLLYLIYIPKITYEIIANEAVNIV